MGTLVYGYAVTVLVTLAIALFVIAYERRRAREIENDPQRAYARIEEMRKGNVRKIP